MEKEVAIQLTEALIFAAPEPVNESRLAEIIGEVSPHDIRDFVEALNHSYELQGRAFKIVRGGGGWRFATHPRFSQWVKRLISGGARIRLSRAALETLSLIAYRQPVSRADIEAIRRVDCDGVVKLLLERRLIRIKGRGTGPGRPILYATTPEFLKYFGLDSLDEMPAPGELLGQTIATGTPMPVSETAELFQPGGNDDKSKTFNIPVEEA